MQQAARPAQAARSPAPGTRRPPPAAPRRFGVGDVVAGVSVALVLIPQSLAYAELAGMPPEHGLYAATLPLLAAFLFASSRYLQTGPVAITSLLTFGALSGLASPGSGEYVGLALLLAVLVGIARLTAGLLRAGVIAYLMSEPLLMGFVPGAALLIVASQLPSALGAGGGDGVVAGAGRALAHPASWQPEAIAVAALTMVTILGGRRLHALFPGVLLATAAGIAWSAASGYGGATIGDVPAGLPPLSGDLPWDQTPSLVLAALVIAFVGFAEPAAISRTLAARDRERWDPDRELVGQGVANVVSGFSGGFPVGGSFSRSSLNRLAGARTPASGAVTGLVVLLFLPLAGVLERVPKATLAAIIIAAAISLVRLAPVARLWRASRPQFLVAGTTFALTLLLEPHVERALLAGVALSVGIHLWRELKLEVAVEAAGGEIEMRPRGVLWFGSARRIEDALLDMLATQPDARTLTLRLDGLGRIDVTGALALRNVVRDARAAGVEVTVAGTPAHARRLVTDIVMPVAEARQRR